MFLYCSFLGVFYSFITINFVTYKSLGVTSIIYFDRICAGPLPIDFENLDPNKPPELNKIPGESGCLVSLALQRELFYSFLETVRAILLLNIVVQ